MSQATVVMLPNSSALPHPARTLRLGCTDYTATWQAMRQFTQQRDAITPDEYWLTEHYPVYTMGLNRRQEGLPQRRDIPLVHTDRGGKMTYHGPGQVVLYLLLDLKRRGLGVRQLVTCIEQAVVALLAEHGVTATSRPHAPGIYTEAGKIASLGLRLHQGRCYHGLALNVDMDLTPFNAIDPCGYPGLPVTSVRHLGVDAPMTLLTEQLLAQVQQGLSA